MTLNELIEELQDILEENESLGETEVNVAFQQNYPLAGFVANVTIVNTDADDDCEHDTNAECRIMDCAGDVPQVWIAITDNNVAPYAPRAAWRNN